MKITVNRYQYWYKNKRGRIRMTSVFAQTRNEAEERIKQVYPTWYDFAGSREANYEEQLYYYKNYTKQSS